MNEKWFNYAIVLTIIMVGINAFLTIGATQTGLDGQPIPILVGLQNNGLSYSINCFQRTIYYEPVCNKVLVNIRNNNV